MLVRRLWPILISAPHGVGGLHDSNIPTRHPAGTLRVGRTWLPVSRRRPAARRRRRRSGCARRHRRAQRRSRGPGRRRRARRRQRCGPEDASSLLVLPALLLLPAVLLSPQLLLPVLFALVLQSELRIRLVRRRLLRLSLRLPLRVSGVSLFVPATVSVTAAVPAAGVEQRVQRHGLDACAQRLPGVALRRPASSRPERVRHAVTSRDAVRRHDRDRPAGLGPSDGRRALLDRAERGSASSRSPKGRLHIVRAHDRRAAWTPARVERGVDAVTDGGPAGGADRAASLARAWEEPCATRVARSEN